MTNQHWFYRIAGKKYLLLFLVLLVNLLVIFGIVLAIEPLWGDINYFLGDMIGFQTNYVFYLLLLIGLPLIYSGILVVLAVRQVIKRQKLKPSIIHTIAAVILIGFFDLLLGVLIIIFGDDAVIVTSLFEEFSICIYLMLAIALFIVMYPLIGFLQRNWGLKLRAIAILGVFLVSLGVGFLLPFLFPPANIISGDLPAKPLIVAHRGAAHLAPENTIIAGQVAVDLGVDAWEIDIQLSRDGIPFLLHDTTLKRTTNVSVQFPGRESEPASNFTWAELQQLDAGSWFVERDPYRAIEKGLVSAAQLQLYRNAKIPSLEEAVNFTRDHGLYLDADFKGVPSWHPNYTNYFNICLSYLQVGGIDDKIWIATGNQNWLNITQLEAPEMITGLSIDLSNPLTVTEFLATGYNMTNIHHALSYEVIRAYVKAGIPINVWTVDNVWRFSQLWCLGVTSIVTNEPHKFVGLITPSWYLHTENYTLFWIIVYIVGLIFVLTLKYEPEEKQA